MEKTIREQAIELAKQLLEKDASLKDFLVKRYPEMEEDPYEQIRKKLISGFQRLQEINETFNDVPIADIITYLEKQENAFENGRQLGIMQEQSRQELEGDKINYDKYDRTMLKSCLSIIESVRESRSGWPVYTEEYEWLKKYAKRYGLVPCK